MLQRDTFPRVEEHVWKTFEERHVNSEGEHSLHKLDAPMSPLSLLWLCERGLQCVVVFLCKTADGMRFFLCDRVPVYLNSYETEV